MLKCERRESASALKINVRAFANFIFAQKLNEIIHHQRSFVTAENFKWNVLSFSWLSIYIEWAHTLIKHSHHKLCAANPIFHQNQPAAAGKLAFCAGFWRMSLRSCFHNEALENKCREGKWSTKDKDKQCLLKTFLSHWRFVFETFCIIYLLAWASNFLQRALQAFLVFNEIQEQKPSRGWK